MNTPTRILAALACAATLAGCAMPGPYYGSGPSYNKTLAGAAIGGAGGALLGYAADDGHGNGALVGGTLGALAGGATGYYLDRNGNQYRGGQPYYAQPRRHRRHENHGDWD